MKHPLFSFKGAYKLLHWSCQRVIEWLKDIEMDDLADRLKGTGVNGAIIVSIATISVHCCSSGTYSSLCSPPPPPPPHCSPPPPPPPPPSISQ